MSTLKLIPGQRVNLTIAAIEQVQGNFGPQYAFKGSTPDDDKATLYINIDTADRQLARLGYDAHSAIGQTIEVARTEKNGTKYTDFNRPSTLPQPNTKPVSTTGYSAGPHIPAIDGPVYREETGAPPKPTPRTDRLDALFTVYDICFDHALQVAKKMDAADIGSDAETVHSIASTLFIGATK